MKIEPETLDTLKDLCKPVMDYLKEYLNPHQKIIISNGYIKIVSDDASIPMRDMTVEEYEWYKSYLQRISKPTGFDVFSTLV